MASPTASPTGPRHHSPTEAGADTFVGSLLAWCALGLVLVARVYRAALLTLVIAAAVPSLWSWSTYVVRSGSMEPAISVGDVVITKPFTTASPVPVGRVMLFTPPDADPDHQNRLHRVVEKFGDGTYATAGDANRSNDAEAVPADNFHGRAIICVPFVGLPLVWWADGHLTPLIIWGLLTAAALYFSSRPSCRGRHRRRAPGTGMDDSGPTRSSMAPRAAVRAGLRPGVGAAGLAAIVVGAAVLPVESADAAFNATTVSAVSTWKVAVNTSRATSKIQVYDTISSSGWYQRSSVAVNISAAASNGATVRSITYRINGGSPVTIRSSSLVFTLNTQGDNTITYHATDSFGAAETAHTAHIKLDNVSPTLAVTSPTGDLSHTQWRAACTGAGRTGGVCGTVVDPIGSGVALVQHVLFRSSDSRCFDGTSWTSAACSTRTPAKVSSGAWLVSVPDSMLATARTWYTITVYAQDVAGNTTNMTRTFSVG
ncbi:MAG: signal peptidase I [Aeromicrobium sp.]